MKKLKITVTSFPVTNAEGKKVELLAITIAYAKNARHGKRNCIITDINGVKYSFPFRISKLIRMFPDFNFLVVKQGNLVNLYQVSENGLHHFSYKRVIMIDGTALEVGLRMTRKLKKVHKKTKSKLKSWRDLIIKKPVFIFV